MVMADSTNLGHGKNTWSIAEVSSDSRKSLDHRDSTLSLNTSFDIETGILKSQF